MRHNLHTLYNTQLTEYKTHRTHKTHKAIDVVYLGVDDQLALSGSLGGVRVLVHTCNDVAM